MTLPSHYTAPGDGTSYEMTDGTHIVKAAAASGAIAPLGQVGHNPSGTARLN